MKRYQIYLNPQSVDVIDALEGELKLSRSGIIRLTVDALARNLLLAIPPEKRSKGALDDLIGIIAPKSSKSTNFAMQTDNTYLAD